MVSGIEFIAREVSTNTGLPRKFQIDNHCNLRIPGGGYSRFSVVISGNRDIMASKLLFMRRSMTLEWTYRHDVRCRRCGSNWMPKAWTHARAASSLMRRLQSEICGGSRVTSLPGACQAASGSDAHSGREHVCGGACSEGKRSIGEWLSEKWGDCA